ncbi:MAG TPA: HAMP domain-containing sensor histidine kinase [Ktedonobacterales bacterium]|nr:HAMP domain-containing sensor histidine kinase [Ktedonobacterales bacterium]
MRQDEVRSQTGAELRDSIPDLRNGLAASASPVEETIASRSPAVVRSAARHLRTARPSSPALRSWRYVRQWLEANTFTPQWLAPRGRVPAAPYLIAALLQIAGSLLTLLIFAVFPSYSFPGILELLIVAMVALSMGGGPSLVATLAGMVMLEWVVLPRAPSGALEFPIDLIESAIFVMVGGVIAIFAGRSERTRQRLEAERAEAKARELASQQTNERVDEFLSILSHELRSPLTGIKAALQLLERRLRRYAAQEKETNPDVERRLEQALETLAIADREVERQNRLVGDLLDISRIRAGKLDYHDAPADLAAIVREAVEAQQLSWGTREITLVMADDAVPIQADADRIAQVVTNLVTNALKYSPESQPVVVKLTCEGNQARIAVRDRGPGLSAEQRQQLWERFHRVPGIEQQSGSGAGLGLGLYICRQIVEHHGGMVGLESVKGRGSTFWFTLPLRKMEGDVS